MLHIRVSSEGQDMGRPVSTEDLSCTQFPTLRKFFLQVYPKHFLLFALSGELVQPYFREPSPSAGWPGPPEVADHVFTTCFHEVGLKSPRIPRISDPP